MDNLLSVRYITQYFLCVILQQVSSSAYTGTWKRKEEIFNTLKQGLTMPILQTLFSLHVQV